MDRPRYHSAILSTREIAESVTIDWRKPRNRYAIPVAGALDLPDADLPVHPYLLGAWLGDGHSYGTQITAHRDDLEIADHIRACGYNVAVEPKDHRRPQVMTLTPSIPSPPNLCRRGHDMEKRGRYPQGQCAECCRQSAMRWKRGLCGIGALCIAIAGAAPVAGQIDKSVLFLVANKDRVLSRSAIVEHVWGDQADRLDHHQGRGRIDQSRALLVLQRLRITSTSRRHRTG